MSRWSRFKRTFLLAFAVAGIGVVIAACTDSVSGPEREPGTILRSGSCPPGVACLPGVVVTAESSEGDCDPFDWSCGSDPCAADPWSCSDPCSVDPWAPGCGNDECSMGYYLPGCPNDPCTYDPYACYGGGETGTGESPPPAAAPEGVEQWFYDKLNNAEKKLCHSHRFECASYALNSGYASVWARQVTPELGTAEGDNKRDALRHTVWQALLTIDMGADRAKVWGDAHETGSTNPMSTCMDQWNNAVGRQIGQTTHVFEVYGATLTAWDQGRLKGAPFSC